ncbi:trehalose-phosphatase [Sphingomonas sp.]|uniref:trehalose-phosphatase n=1 Tax=Sphingomonas sp. TaxID=28214 RepID=UPI001EC55DF3|nr:trehalose-phosphatase [Sphingomonas sp.]MBX3594684.1 trehalose-phosphatase [Sphingomonas sp.]
MPDPAETKLADALAPPPVDLLVGASLFLDFDGTLVEIVDRPDAVRVDADLGGLIRALARRLDGRLAIVSGRGAHEIAALFDHPDFTIGGSHGAELRLADGTVRGATRPAELDRVLDTMRAFAARRPGVLVEAKTLGAGLHFRGAPAAEAECAALAADLAQTSGLTLQEGKMVFELRAPGDKGAAIGALMAMTPFAGSHPVFLGDDVTDEDGFAAADALDGAGILVGPMRATAARHRLPDVAGVRAWLTQFVEECR